MFFCTVPEPPVQRVISRAQNRRSEFEGAFLLQRAPRTTKMQIKWAARPLTTKIPALTGPDETQRVGGSVNGSVGGSVSGWVGLWVCGWVCGLVCGWVCGWVCVWVCVCVLGVP